MIEDVVTEFDGIVRIPIEVVPNSKSFSVSWDEWRNRIKMKIRSKAQKGKANEEIISFFKEVGDATIIKGTLGKEKLVEVGADRESVILLLNKHLND